MSLTRVYWLNVDRHRAARVAMHTQLAKSRVAHVRVSAIDAERDLAGNVTRGTTLSHVRLFERVHADKPHGQTVLVMEDTASFEYAPYWTTTLDAVVAQAPADWGVIQLAYRCDEPTVHRVHRTMTDDEHLNNFDAHYVEKRVLLDDDAPYVPWSKWQPSLACAYLLHPRGYRALLAHAQSKAFYPDAPVWEALFPHTRTYTYHLPMFTTRADRTGFAPQRSMSLYREPLAIERAWRERRARTGTLVRTWHERWLRAREG